MIWYVILIVAAFLVLWSSSDLIIDGVAYLAAKAKLPDFWVSFFVLGLAMTAPELSVGINSAINGIPDVYVGNLLGSTMAIFLLVVPVMAIVGNGVTLVGKMSKNKMTASFALILVPFVIMANGRVSYWEGIVCVLVYLALCVYFGIKAGDEKVVNSFDRRRLGAKPWLPELIKFGIGLGLILFSGNVLLDSIEYFVSISGSSFYVLSFFLLSLGTTAPELMVVFKSVISGKKDVAFGGYLGSAVANSMLFGLFSILAGSFVIDKGIYFGVLFILFLLGMIMFYVFSESKDELSRREGVVLIVVYLMIITLTAYL